MGQFEELLGEIEDAGLSPELLGRLKNATAASPIRAERDAAKAEAEAARREAAELKAYAMRATFKEAGIAINPAALNLPADLDYKNAEAVRTWGTEMGLISTTSQPPPTTPPNEQHGAQSFIDPGAGSGNPDLEATKLREMADLRHKRYGHGQAPDLRDVLQAAAAAGWEDTRGR